MLLTFAQCFGASAFQDSTSITFLKSELPGLRPLTENTAESLVVGILLKVLSNFEGKLTDETGNTVTDENGVPITYFQGDIAETFYLFNWRIIFRKKSSGDYKIYQLVIQEFSDYS